jgi:hypothetical protein
MENLMNLITVAAEMKPTFGQTCNHCGWCCLTGPCVVGQEITGKMYGACELLKTDGDKHYCSMAGTKDFDEAMGFGTGCDAKTQNEQLAEMMAANT